MFSVMVYDDGFWIELAGDKPKRGDALSEAEAHLAVTDNTAAALWNRKTDGIDLKRKGWLPMDLEGRLMEAIEAIRAQELVVEPARRR